MNLRAEQLRHMAASWHSKGRDIAHRCRQSVRLGVRGDPQLRKFMADYIQLCRHAEHLCLTCARFWEDRLTNAELRAIYHHLQSVPGPLDARARAKLRRRAEQEGGPCYVAQRYAAGVDSGVRFDLTFPCRQAKPLDVARAYLAELTDVLLLVTDQGISSTERARPFTRSTKAIGRLLPRQDKAR